MSNPKCGQCEADIHYCRCENDPMPEGERLYILSYYGHDGGSYQILRGKDIGGEKKWKAFVDSLLPHVTDLACEIETRPRTDGDIHKGWVGSSAFHEALLVKLEELGYERINPVAASFWECGIYDVETAKQRSKDRYGDERFLRGYPEAEDKVIAHNEEVRQLLEAGMDRRREERKAKKSD